MISNHSKYAVTRRCRHASRPIEKNTVFATGIFRSLKILSTEINAVSTSHTEPPIKAMDTNPGAIRSSLCLPGRYSIAAIKAENIIVVIIGYDVSLSAFADLLDL